MADAVYTIPGETRIETKGSLVPEVDEWHNVLVYPKLKDLPDVIKSFEVERGKIHFTEGMNFELLGFI